MSLDLLEKISNELPHIRYCKIFLEKPEKIAQIHDRCKGRIIPWAGHDRLTYRMLCYGAYGMTSAASCVLPSGKLRYVQSRQGGKIGRGEKYLSFQGCSLNAMAFFNVPDFIAAYKLALYWMGIIKTPTLRSCSFHSTRSCRRNSGGP